MNSIRPVMRLLLTASAAVLVVLGALNPATAASAENGLAKHNYACLQRMLGGRPPAAPGSANPAVVARFSSLQRPPLTGPVPSGLRSSMTHELVASYDPNGLRQLRPTLISHLDAVPAEIASPALPAGCASLAAVPGYAEYIALLRLSGSGPGACLVNIGKGYAACAALPGLTGYIGALGLGGTEQLAYMASMVPAGVDTVTFRYVGGKTQTFHPVHGVIETIRGGAIEAPRRPPSPAVYLAKSLPITITESGSGASVTYARPATLIPMLAGSMRFSNHVQP